MSLTPSPATGPTSSETGLAKIIAKMNRDSDEYDKQWASKYILGPLYDPEPSQVCATRVSKALPPTPPSESPTRPYFSSRHSRSKSHADDILEDQPFFRRILSRSNSVNNRALPPSPPRTKPPPLSPLERKRSVHTSRPPATHWNQGTILARSNSVATSRPSIDSSVSMAEREAGRRRGSSLAERYPGDMSHRPLATLMQEHYAKDEPEPELPRRGGSLRERYPGDMSHRPLAMLKRDHRAADRAPHLHSHRRQQPSDPIDALDHTGPVPEAVYHHGGPFDPTMKSRNTNPMYSPVEAVKDSNMEALKATPAEFVQDSLDKHVPLQGIASVPPGMKDMGGRTMVYREGADLMREKDAPGGAYKRWDDLTYRDDDLKGKGEPAFSMDKDIKNKQLARKPVASQDGIAYEMQPQTVSGRQKDGGARARHRSASNTDGAPPPPPKDFEESGSGIRRSNTTGKSLADSFKRRFGSLRRKKVSEERVY